MRSDVFDWLATVEHDTGPQVQLSTVPGPEDEAKARASLKRQSSVSDAHFHQEQPEAKRLKIVTYTYTDRSNQVIDDLAMHSFLPSIPGSTAGGISETELLLRVKLESSRTVSKEHFRSGQPSPRRRRHDEPNIKIHQDPSAMPVIAYSDNDIEMEGVEDGLTGVALDEVRNRDTTHHVTTRPRRRPRADSEDGLERPSLATDARLERPRSSPATGQVDSKRLQILRMMR